MKKDTTAKDMKKVGKTFGLEEWVTYMRSPWRIIWTNFIAGLFRGLGTVIGATVIFGFLIWALGFFVDFPLIGEQFKEFKTLLENFNQNRP